MSFFTIAMAALELDDSIRVFPLRQNSKLPAIKDYAGRATRDVDAIKAWDKENPNFNVGIPTDDFLVLDVDNKKGNRGSDEILKLEMEGFVLEPTLETRTPNGGVHYFHSVESPIKQGTNVLGPGLDVRARGGYVVGPGSKVAEGEYVAIKRPIRIAPEWLLSRCDRHVVRDRSDSEQEQAKVDSDRATKRVVHYLTNEAPLSIEGNGGDETAFLVACKVKDFGVSREEAAALMDHYWNPRCNPPWPFDDLCKKVANAYSYGTEPVGAAAPEKQFQPVVPEGKAHPVLCLNDIHAYLPKGQNGGAVLYEYKDEYNKHAVDYWGLQTFHNFYASRVLNVDGGKTVPITKLWMTSPDRRTYRGVRFCPGLEAPTGFYNLWKGFTVEPYAKVSDASKRERAALDAYLTLVSEVVCESKQDLTDWVIGFFAHMIQRPWEKPLVALVFQGAKGVGKNSVIERIGALLGDSFMVVGDNRYLVGNFNAHLENKLCVVFDESFWGGDKKADSHLKHLVTGDKHVIERKGMEAYAAKNYLRVVAMGNEEWLVPASHDERRYAVFKMNERKKQHNSFFQEIREGMEAGGYRLLLRYLLDFDLSKTDVNQAPITEGLKEQKLLSQPLFSEWWYACLCDGRIVGADFGDEWPEIVSPVAVRSAYERYLNDRRIRTSVPNDIVFGRKLFSVLPSMTKFRPREEGSRPWKYRLPSLQEARDAWVKHIGQDIDWENV